MLGFIQKLGYMLAKKTNKKTIKSKENIDTTSNSVFLQIKPFKDNDHGVGHWESLIRNLVSVKKKKINFLIRGNSSDIKFFANLPKDFKKFFQNAFFSSFPTSDLVEIPDMKFAGNKENIVFSENFILNDKEVFNRDGSYMDPMNNILSIYNTIQGDTKLDINFKITYKLPLTLTKIIKDIIKRFFTSKKKQEEEKLKKPEIKPEIYLSIGFKIYSKDIYDIEHLKRNIFSSFAPFLASGKIKLKRFEKFIPMTYSQVVNFFHIPTMTNFVKGLDYTLYRKLAYPTNIPTLQNSDKSDLTVLGNTDYRGEKITFGIKKEDKFRHIYIVGKTGTGKSIFLANMIKSDMIAGNGLALLDPHGELVDTVLEHIPTNRINDVIMFDVSDSDYPIGFNLLQSDTEEGRNLVASGVVSTFKKLFDNSWGPRLEYILRNVVLSIVDYPNATLMHILRVLTDKNFREEVISHVKDSVVLKFWQTEFNKRNDKQRDEAISPITNKVGQFLSSKLVRNIFGQPRTKLSLRKAMDEGKIILVNLSKGRIGEDNANMIGSLLVTKFQIDAMSRANIPANQRKDFYLYIDEFQNFATESFTTILSEARKYKLSLIVANQYTAQILPEIRDAIFGNVGTTIAFTVGKDDADIITGQFKNMVSVNDLISLPKYTTYTRLMIDGISSDPFSTKTLNISTPEGSLELIDKIRKQSRQRYAMERKQLERLMDARNSKTFSLQEKVAEKAKLEAMGISQQEAENLQDIYIAQHIHYFTEFTIDTAEPDAIIFDIENSNHKAIRYQKPKGLEDQANLKFKKGQKVPLKNGSEMMMHVDIYQHQTINIENNGSLMIWIGSKEDVLKQMNDIYANAGIKTDLQNFLKFCPNMEKLQKLLPKENLEKSEIQTAGSSTNNKISPVNVNPSEGKLFTIKDIKLGQEYEGYVKLSYNYGMFVTVKGVEGLLHKNWIVAPAGVERKKYYNIGDKIKVKAKEFKEVNGEQKVVWSQK